MRRPLVILLLMSIIGCLVVAAVWQDKQIAIMAGAKAQLEQEVNARVGGRATIESIGIGGISSVFLHGVQLRDQAGELALAAKTVQVQFNPLQLLMGISPLEAVHRVILDTPQLFLRQRHDESWNVEDLLPEQDQQSANAFGGSVQLEHGQVVITTYNKGSYQLDEVAGTVGFSAQPALKLQLKGRHQQAKFVVEGTINGIKQLALTAKIDQLSLAQYQGLVAAESVALKAGHANRVAVTVIKDQGQLHYSGEAQLADAAFVIDDTEITAATGLLSFDQDSVHIYNGTATVWQQQLNINGKIMYRGTPVFALTLSSQALDTTVFPQLELTGTAALQAKVTGTLAEYTLAGQVTMASGSYWQLPFEQAATEFVFESGRLQLTGLALKAFGGTVTVDGLVDTNVNQADLKIAGKSLATKQIATVLNVADAAGTTELDLLVRGPLDLAALDAVGLVNLVHGQVAGVPFDRVQTGFKLQGGVLQLDYFTALLAAGVLNVAGSWDVGNDALAITVAGEQLPLAALSASLPPAVQATGDLALTAIVSGSSSRPQLALSLSASNGQLAAQPFEQLTGELALTAQQLEVKALTAVNGNTVHTISGQMGLTGEHLLELKVATRQARMETLLQAVPAAVGVTGNVNNDLIISGSLAAPVVTGTLHLSKGSYQGYLLNSVDGGYSYTNNTLEFNDLVINSLDNELTVNGSITDNQQLALRVTGRNIDLERLPVPYPYPVSGKGRLIIRVDGTIERPQIRSRAVVSQLIANGQTFERVDANIRISGSRFDCEQATFRQGDAEYQLRGGVDLATRNIYGSLVVDNADAASIAALAKQDNIVEGQVNGYFGWHGSLTNPSANFRGTVTNGIIKGYTLGDIDVEAELVNRVIELKKFQVTQAAGKLAAQGTIDLVGDIKVEAGAQNIDAAIFAKLLTTDLDTTGSLNFTAQISGQTRSPHTAISLEIVNGTVNTASFDSLYGLLAVADGKVNINQLLLAKGEYKASAYGVVPLAVLDRTAELAPTEQMDITLRLDHANLSILPIMTKEVSAAAGPTQGELRITGTPFAPKLDGRFSISDGHIKFRQIVEPVQKVTLDLQFEDDTIQVRTFSGEMGKGYFSLQGSTVVRDSALHDYDLALELANLSLTHKYFKGPLNGQLRLTETRNRPQLTGKLQIENTTLAIPMALFADTAAADFNLGLGVELIVGEKVRLYNSGLYDVWVEGKVDFGGSIRWPDVSGRIEALRGTLTYLRTQFRIDEGVVAFNQVRSFEPSISLKASTRLEQTNINLTLTGPVSAMEIDLASEPQMSQQSILSLLTLRGKYSEHPGDDGGLGRDELLMMLNAGLQLQFFSEIEGMLRNTLGVDEFTIRRGTGGNYLFNSERVDTDSDQYQVEIGKYINNRLLLRYATGLESGEQSYGVRYDLTKRLGISADRNEFDEWQVGISLRLKF